MATLPQAQVPNEAIPAETLNRIPKELALEFGAVFFTETPIELYLGIRHPELLKDRVNEALAVLQQQVGKKIKLFLISEADFSRVMAQYALPKPAVVKPITPPNYTVGGDVVESVLATMPPNYARDKHLITVDTNSPGEYWVATDRPSDKQQLALQLIERRNRITLHVIEVPASEFSRLLTIREAVDERLNNPPEPKEAADAAAAIDRQETVPVGPAGQIITGEVEKAGVAGLLQRASGFFGGTNPAAAATAAVKLPPEPKLSDAVVKEEPLPNHEPSKTPAEEQPLTVPAETSVPAEPIVPYVPVIKNIGISRESDESAIVGGEVDVIFRRPVTDIKQLQVIVRQGSVPRILAGIINYAVEQRASDIHIEPYSDELLIRYRVDGQLGEVIKLPTEIQPAMVSRVKILSKLKLDEQRIPQDGRFDVVVAGEKEIDIRVSTLPTVHGEKVVMRLLDKSGQIYTLEKLGLSGAGLDRLLNAIKQPYGVILATGPTGSGKTTTLYAILQRVVTSKVNVITLEDPVEYEMKGVNQSQIKPKIGFTFAEGLRSVLRQDPNIIMVGEVRDAETASMATHAALTGHLVLTTLHTNNAAGALPRLINMGVEPFLITSAMNAIVGQRLVRKLCPNCREKFDLPDTVRKEIDTQLEEIKRNNPKEASRIPANIEFYRPLEGCKDCAAGYRGRVGLYEVFAMDEKIEDLAIKKAPAIEIERTAKEAGMITMKQDGILKVLEGLTTLDEILRETSDR
ncbi:MAG: GspE/PulE family protein [bacterium]|nr:GspE/PulE family protein [bacterium]